jgi:hypothetical protein
MHTAMTLQAMLPKDRLNIPRKINRLLTLHRIQSGSGNE